MILRVNRLVNQCKTKEDYLVKLIGEVMKDMSKARDEIDSLANSINVESVILKEPIENKKGENND